MQPSSDADLHQPREMTGLCTRLLVGCVRDWGGQEAVAAVLAAAGEQRSAEVLEDERTWTSYAVFCRMLHAAADVLGDPSAPRRIGAAVTERQVGTSTRMLLRALGSPASVYRSIHRTSPKISSIGTSRAVDVRRTSARIEMGLADGCDHDAAFQEFIAGLVCVVPCLFGLPPATARKEVGPNPREWALDITWARRRRRGAAGIEDELLTARTESSVLAAHLETFSQTVADLVSPASIDEVLGRIVSRMTIAVQAHQVLLAVHTDDESAPLIYGDGMTNDLAWATGIRLLAGDYGESGSELLVEVRSSRHAYGWLLAANPPEQGFLAGERQLLESYGRLAATALDSATALEEATSQGRTASELLALAGALAGLTDAADIAETLVRSIPTLTGAERGSLYLWDPTSESMTLSANAGMPAELDAQLRGTRLTERDTPELLSFLAAPQLRIYERSAMTDPFLINLFDMAGTRRAVVVPLAAGELFGAVVATWCDDTPFALTATFRERMQGLADSGTTALRTARLVERMRHLAMHDQLTDLPNRSLLADRVEAALERATQTGSSVGVLFCDLDDFKRVNDRLGHAAGDELLCEVARRLRSALRPTDLPARLGGDEFAVLLEDLDSTATAERVAQRIIADLRRPIFLEGQPVSISASIGIAIEGGGSSPSALLDAADAAMYATKAGGKNAHTVFRPEHRAAALRHQGLSSDLERAVSAGGLRLEYQPIVRVADGTTAGVEALLRWDHPTEGAIPARAIIRVAEETGLIVPLGRWVLGEACRQGHLLGKGFEQFTVSVNVSGRQIHAESFVADVAEALAVSGLPATRLLLEVGEEVLATDARRLARVLVGLRSLGVRLAIDDYGAGHSSITQLLDVRPDVLKLAPEITGPCADDAHARSRMHGVVDLAVTLGIATVAEAVETPKQAVALREAGCMFAQGYHHARPAPAESLNLQDLAAGPRPKARPSVALPAGPPRPGAPHQPAPRT